MATIKKPYFLTLLATCCSLLCMGQIYTDLKDQGYRGPAKLITTKFYSDISYKNKRWTVNDSLHPNTILSEHFNKQGNLTLKEINTVYDTSRVKFEYKGDTKSGWTKKDKKGIILETAKLMYETPGKFKEIISDFSDSSKTELTYALDNTGWTKKLEELRYDSKGAITYHLVSKNEDDRDGKYWRIVNENKLTNETDIFYFTFLAKDKQNNPTTVLVKKNEVVIAIRLVSFIYNTEK